MYMLKYIHKHASTHTPHKVCTPYFPRLPFLHSSCTTLCIVLKLPTFVKLLWQLLLFVVDAVVNDGWTKLNVNAIKCAVNVLVMLRPHLLRLQYDFPKLKINLNKLVVLIKAIRTHIDHHHQQNHHHRVSHHIAFDFRWSINDEKCVRLENIIFGKIFRIIEHIHFTMEILVSNRKCSQSNSNFLWSHLNVTNSVTISVKYWVIEELLDLELDARALAAVSKHCRNSR